MSDSLSPGKVSVGLNTEAKATLFVFRYKLGYAKCTDAIGFGTFEITKAEKTREVGGKLEFTATKLSLYSATDTPSGNVTSRLPKDAPPCKS